MISKSKQQEYYQALITRDVDYDGRFYVGVKTTGVFCRATCPARKPKIENCEFFATSKEALVASFRPCKRCRPLSHPNEVSPVVQKLVDAIEANPEKRWKDADFRELSIDASTARRQFKKRFGMTFVEYARTRRVGLAMQHIKTGAPIIDAQLNAGYESSSGFRDAFSRIMGAAPTRLDNVVLKARWIDTCLGPMLAVADDEALYLLEFVERRGLEREIERMRQKCRAAIIPGDNAILQLIGHELEDYFSGKNMHFTTPIHVFGSPFQQTVWKALQTIPLGQTWSYSDLAAAIKKPTAMRAVANANGANQLALIIPCHRVIRANGDIGGYGGGVHRKVWLLEHEKAMG